MTIQRTMSKRVFCLSLLFSLYFGLSSNIAYGLINIAHVPEKEPLSPFEMASVAVSVSSYDYNDTVIKNTGNALKLEGKATQTIYNVSIDQPLYEKYVGAGLNLALSTGFDPFTSFVIDSSLSLNFRYPFDLGPMGDVALTSSIGGGFSMMFAGQSGEIAFDIPINSNSTYIERNLADWNKNITLKPGMVGTFSVGVDYYPVRWAGIFAEVETRHYSYFDSIITKKVTKGRDLQFLYTKNFSYSTPPSLVIGLKTTF